MAWHQIDRIELNQCGWVGVGGFSKVVATFRHVDGSFNLFMATTRDVWIIPSFRIWDYVLHVVHISCVITNCGQHQWVIPSPLSTVLKALLEENTTRKLLSLSLDLFFKSFLFQVTFLIFFSVAIFFYPRPVLAFGYCRCLRLCVCVSVRASITSLSTR